MFETERRARSTNDVDRLIVLAWWAVTLDDSVVSHKNLKDYVLLLWAREKIAPCMLSVMKIYFGDVLVQRASAVGLGRNSSPLLSRF